MCSVAVFVIFVLAHFQLYAQQHAAECESVTISELCKWKFGCFWDESVCYEQEDYYIENAPCSAYGDDLHDYDGINTFCQEFTSGGQIKRVVHGPVNSDVTGVDLCSFYDAVLGECPEMDGAGQYCEIVNVDPTNELAQGCFTYQGPSLPVDGICSASPPPAECLPCHSGSSCCTSSLLFTFTCDSYCANSGSQSTCCGRPATPATASSNACGNYTYRYTSTYMLQQACVASINANPNNPDLAACALCDSYYTCCDNGNGGTNPAICTAWCNGITQASNADCKKRQECIDSLGHPPTEAELSKCGTTMVRLSSFTVAVLLGVLALFFLD